LRLHVAVSLAASSMVLACSSIDASGSGNTGIDGGTPAPVQVVLDIHTTGNGVVRGAGADCRGQCRITLNSGSKVHLAAVADSGSKFTGWAGACSGTVDCDLTLSADQAVTAAFAAIPASAYPLTVTVTGQGRVTSSPAGIDCPAGPCSATFGAGSAVELTAAASSGWQLSGWSGACNGAGSCNVTMNAPASADARFTEVPPPPPPPPPPPDECAGLGPQPALPQDYALEPMEQSCQPGVGDSHGLLLFTARRSNPSQGTMELFAPRDQPIMRGQFLDTYMRLFSEPEGLEGLLTSNSQGYVYAQHFDSDGVPRENGGPLQHPSTPWPAADPTGGLMIAGDLGYIRPAATPSPSLFSYGSGPGPITRWDRRLSSRGPVVGIGVDVNGRTLVVTDGAAAYGAGTISGEWFDAAGNGSGEFKLFGDFTPGRSTWFQLAPLIGGGLAVARFDGTGPHDITSAWIGVVGSLSHAMDAAPAWLSSRGNTWLEIVRGGKAYAFLPLGAAKVTCAPQIEVVSPGGQSCGTHALFLASGTCDTFDVTAGKDGTLMVELPDSMERSSGAGRSCTWRAWREELR
jgi:hypothetical protein